MAEFGVASVWLGRGRNQLPKDLPSSLPSLLPVGEGLGYLGRHSRPSQVRNLRSHSQILHEPYVPLECQFQIRPSYLPSTLLIAQHPERRPQELGRASARMARGAPAVNSSCASLPSPWVPGGFSSSPSSQCDPGPISLPFIVS